MKKFFRKLFGFVFIILIIVLAVIVSGGYGKYKQALGLLPIEEAIEDIRNQESFTPIEEISPTFVNAMVAVEDRRFYKHKGVDIIALIRAVKTNIEKKSLSQGGSSISQQLAKNIYFMQDRSLSRKIAELLITVKIEKELSKEEILELYFNVIYYGSGYYNIKDATMGYFHKQPSALSDYEATLLAGVPNAPSVYSPDKNPDLAKKRQKTVLKSMVEAKMITGEEMEKILSFG